MDPHKLFQISVKGLYFNEEKKLMMVQEEGGDWELPGGRLEVGENLAQALEREIQEEMHLTCKILETTPSIIYSTIDNVGRGRLMVCYKIQLNSLQFTPTEECRSIGFFSKKEITSLKKVPQLEKLVNYL